MTDGVKERFEGMKEVLPTLSSLLRLIKEEWDRETDTDCVIGILVGAIVDKAKEKKVEIAMDEMPGIIKVIQGVLQGHLFMAMEVYKKEYKQLPDWVNVYWIEDDMYIGTTAMEMMDEYEHLRNWEVVMERVIGELERHEL